MKVLVTGGAGFIGSHVVERLLTGGMSVVVVDNLITGCRSNVPPEVPLYVTDVAAPELLDVFAGERPDYCIHLAAQISVGASLREPEEDARVNIDGTINVLRACHSVGVKRLVYGSSAAVYGDPSTLPLAEDARLAPLSPYGISKKCAEDYLRVLGGHYGIEPVVLRYANAYGPRQAISAECGVITIFVNSIIERKTPVIFGDGGATRDFLYVGDIAEATYMALFSQHTGVFNIGSGIEVTVTELWSALSAASGVVLSPRHGQARPGDIYRSCLEVVKANELLGWRASTSLEEGLRLTLDYYRRKAGL